MILRISEVATSVMGDSEVKLGPGDGYFFKWRDGAVWRTANINSIAGEFPIAINPECGNLNCTGFFML